jgi:hypothetical protein
LYRWQREFRQAPGNAFPGQGQRRWSEGQIAELERKIGRQAVEIDFLKGCLQRIEEQRMLQVSIGNPQSTARRRRSGGWAGTEHRADGGAGAGEPCQFLPLQRGRGITT